MARLQSIESQLFQWVSVYHLLSRFICRDGKFWLWKTFVSCSLTKVLFWIRLFLRRKDENWFRRLLKLLKFKIFFDLFQNCRFYSKRIVFKTILFSNRLSSKIDGNVKCVHLSVQLYSYVPSVNFVFVSEKNNNTSNNSQPTNQEAKVKFNCHSCYDFVTQ